MADTDGDKTEAPTPRRRQQAAEQGQVVRSPDLVAAALVVGSMVLLKHFGGDVLVMLRNQLIEALSTSSDLDGITAARRLGRAMVLMGKVLWPLLLGLVVIAIVGNIIQVGLNFNTKRLQPNLGALNPLKGFSRMFGFSGNPMKFVMSMAKMAVITFVAWTALSNRFMQIVMAQQQAQEQVFGLAATTLYDIALRIGMALLVLAIIDYVWQRWKHERDLRMTKQEVKEEMRSMEGDPKIKQRRRQIAMQMATKRLKKDVPTADVVVTNPTEYAVALRYDSATMIAPIVVAKGQGLIAARIRQIAIENGVPILERKPLARALYKLVEVGGAVPEQFYSAIAEILAYVYELTGKSKRKVAV
jgi:flagellar biosynthetic protein FlhB